MISAPLCSDLKEQAAEPAPDLSIPLPSASYLGSKGYDEPSSVEGFFDTWASIARQAKASQPHWITPLATVTPRLEQEFRYDEFFEHTEPVPTSKSMTAAKALRSFPTMTNEVLINLPPHNDRTIVKPASGWSDWPAITVKQRLLSANEENGN